MITNYKKLLILLTAIMSLVSCKKYLDTDPKGQFLLSNYYSNKAQAYTGVVACYNVLPYNYYAYQVALNGASDDSYTGGGNSGDQAGMQAFNNYPLINSASHRYLKQVYGRIQIFPGLLLFRPGEVI